MILLISTSDCEQSTDEIIDWLVFKGQKFERLNGKDILENSFSEVFANYIVYHQQN